MVLHLTKLLLMLTLCRLTATKEQPDVKAPAGTFRGKVLTSFSGADYVSYRGIPFALPPTGERRFAKPVPHPPIQGVFYAGDFGPMCLQNWKGARVGREDCLSLNVYTPLVGQKTGDSGLKKVYVFIHGGGFVVGSSNPYVPGDLVTRSDLVVVTINYRINWFGYLRGNSSSIPGNVAYWDQVLALKWVKDNIKHFGGDPTDVTLSGESAGSISTAILSTAPAAKGLFSKALLLSGGVNTFPMMECATNNILEIAAAKFGCDADPVSGNEDKVVACLKQVPAENFVLDFDFLLLVTGTCKGDDILPRNVAEMLRDTSYLSEVGFLDRDYLASITAEDGNIMVNTVFSKLDTSSPETISRDILIWLQLPEQATELVVREYVKLFGDLDRAATAIITDSFFLKNTIILLDAFTQQQNLVTSKRNRNAYLMSFDHKPKYVPNQYMLHALDLCYLFDLKPKDLVNAFYLLDVTDFYDEDLKLKADYIDMVTDFLKSGKPGERLAQKNNLAWSPYDPNRKSYLSYSGQPSVREDVLGDRRYIWDKLVPQWLEEHKDVVGGKQEL